MKKYDAVLILGRGIDEHGNMPEVAYGQVRKAVKLFKNDQTKNLIFCGRWSYHDKYDHVATEAETMAKYASDLGVPDESIHIEDKSEATVINICNAKREFLKPKGWKNIAFITLYPLVPRIKLNAEYVLGDEYTCDYIDAGIRYPKDIEAKKLASETRKMKGEAVSFIKTFTKGDDEAIYKAATLELAKRKQKINK